MQNILNIQTFIEVARTGSFVQAGRRLSVPRSTVSARIRTLEERLNVRLLHRTTRRVSLTDEGRLYMERCEEALERLMSAEAELTSSEAITGTIRLTVPVDFPKIDLAVSLKAFRKLYPDIDFEVIVTDDPVDLIDENIDVALRGRSPGHAGVVVTRLGEGRVGLYADPSYLGKVSGDGVLKTLEGHVVFDPGRLAGRKILKGALKGFVNTHDFELAKAFAIQSLGLVLLPSNLCKQEVKNKALVEVVHALDFPSLPLYLIVPTRKHVPLRIRKFTDFVISQGQLGLGLS